MAGFFIAWYAKEAGQYAVISGLIKRLYLAREKQIYTKPRLNQAVILS